MSVETASRLAPATDDLLARLRAIVGAANALDADADTAAYLREPRNLYKGRTRCVVRPKTRDEVAAVLALFSCGNGHPDAEQWRCHERDVTWRAANRFC